uniref:Nucleotid_trans domain-containing protein n=1 Tax=Rhabditophanes sp. KR3021 TaxID=114890 RepID=A0AC35TGE5_9BILA
MFYCLYLFGDTEITKHADVIEIPSFYPRREYIKHNITIISLMNTDNFEDYLLPIDTMKCYSIYHSYNHHVFNIYNYPDLLKNCTQRDFMYQRHCFLANYMKLYINPNEYVVFVDADMGIINYNHLLEKYLPSGKEEILFYHRLFNFEIACGSYIVKNTKYSRDFLNEFANYDFRHPNSFDGSDNVGLHYFLSTLVKHKLKDINDTCFKVWNSSTNWGDTWNVVGCFQQIIHSDLPNKHNLISTFTLDNGKIAFIGKYEERRWVRDVTLAGKYWSFNDFMLHGLKMSKMNKKVYLGWASPIMYDKFNLTLCKELDFYKNWKFKIGQIGSKQFVKKELQNLIESVEENRNERLRRMSLL